MNPQALQVLIAVLSVLLLACVTVIGFGVKSYINNNKTMRTALNKISTSLEVLNTGASAGARQMIEHVEERLEEHDLKLDAQAERHNSLALSVGIMTDRFSEHRRSPASMAHPPAVS